MEISFSLSRQLTLQESISSTICLRTKENTIDDTTFKYLSNKFLNSPGHDQINSVSGPDPENIPTLKKSLPMNCFNNVLVVFYLMLYFNKQF